MKWTFIVFLQLIVFYSLAQTFPAGFSRVQVGGSISSPTVLAFAPDGRIFVAQQGGALRVIKNGVLLPTPFITLSSVSSLGERGLIGIALDPDFSNNGYVYLYYTTSVAPIHNRIVRYTANGDVALAGSELPILELDNLSGATNHNGGALAFDPDGKLYVAVGDNATGSHAQNLDIYHGKFLRINKDGSAPTDNPFYSGAASEQRKRIWSYGLRNPYTFTIEPGTGKIFVNDVGQNAVEEINDATAGGKNFGWPATEGHTTNPAYTSPVYAYNHSGAAPTGCAITSGTFFNPQFTSYPASYLGNYFFQDYCGNWIYALNLTATPTATLFGSNVGGSSIALTTGPDGNLYYLSRGSSALYKIVSNNVNAPTIIQQPAGVAASEGTSVSFSVSVAGTTPLQYQWLKNDLPIANATSATFTLNPVTLTDAGEYKVRITNTAGQVTSNAATLTVTPNTKPIATIQLPTSTTTYAGGIAISFSGSATDAEDGTLAATALSWQVNFHHDEHVHDGVPVSGIATGTFNVPDEGEVSANVWYRFILTATDAQGAFGKDSVDVLPRKSMLNFTTQPAGLQILVDGQPRVTPLSIESVEGIKRQIGVNEEQSLNENNYTFTQWAHGGAATQIIVTPADEVTYIAEFSLVVGVENSKEILFPNPTSDWLYLQDQVTPVRITNYLGQAQPIQSERAGNQTRLDLRSLATGMYILMYEYNKARSVTKLVIVR